MNWIDLNKEMPKYNERVLLLGTGDGVFIGELKEKPMRDEDGWEVEGEHEGSITILDYFCYWMPLPEPPKEAEQFTKAVELLRDLADLQNGPPLERHRKEWEETIQQVYDFLNKWEPKTIN